MPSAAVDIVCCRIAQTQRARANAARVRRRCCRVAAPLGSSSSSSDGGGDGGGGDGGDGDGGDGDGDGGDGGGGSVFASFLVEAAIIAAVFYTFAMNALVSTAPRWSPLSSCARALPLTYSSRWFGDAHR